MSLWPWQTCIDKTTPPDAGTRAALLERHVGHELTTDQLLITKPSCTCRCACSPPPTATTFTTFLAVPCLLRLTRHRPTRLAPMLQHPTHFILPTYLKHHHRCVHHFLLPCFIRLDPAQTHQACTCAATPYSLHPAYVPQTPQTPPQVCTPTTMNLHILFLPLFM